MDVFWIPALQYSRGHEFYNTFLLKVKLSKANDCVFETEDVFRDFSIFDESTNEDVGGEFERVLMFDESSKGDIDVEDVPIYDEYPSEDIDGDEDGVENVGSSNEEQEMPIFISNEPRFLQWDDSKQVDDSCDVLEPSVVTYVEEVLSLKRHGKWKISWHISKDTVDVHKRKLILKIEDGLLHEGDVN
ncbi:hypothetical protein RHMOL_Rhmol08G0189000 [Rhododendron molle]|uniref:Uncharacterized protein n=1 Tax=Rhododendron molle TaxID=49168 RepID=A0ACC0MRX3_RHOML|nr:hypothetical protein RHMOL_Rhmol08G0189000 [Rhododendron molle]